MHDSHAPAPSGPHASDDLPPPGGLREPYGGPPEFGDLPFDDLPAAPPDGPHAPGGPPAGRAGASGRSAPGTAAAVVLATTAGAALRCGGGTLLDRLTDQLVALSVGEVHVVARSGDITRVTDGAYLIGAEGSHGLADDLRRVARVARAATGPVAVLAGDLVAHTEALAVLLSAPGGGTTALVVTDGDEPGPLRPPVRVEGGRVAAAGTSLHEVAGADGTFRGALRVGEADLGRLAETAETLAGLAETGVFGAMGGAEAGDLLLAGLVRYGVHVRARGLGRLRCERVAGQEDADAAVRRLNEVDVAHARLDAAVKADDGFFATYGVSSWSGHLVRPAAALGLTPNAVTWFSAGLALLAAAWFSAGTRPALVAGAVLVYLSFVLDCVDGQLARYTRTFSPVGAWLDATFDRAKEYVVYVGLAVGYAAGHGAAGGGPEGIWALAVAAMILQALRHMIDFSYAGSRADAGAARARSAGPSAATGGPSGVPADAAARLAPSRPAPPYGTSAGSTDAGGTDTGSTDAGSTGAGSAAGQGPGERARAAPQGSPPGNPVVRLSRLLERSSTTRWLKKIIVLPIGERMALIAVTAALFNARVTFLALLTWGGVAALYTLTGRIGRSLSK
ncbi:CDP-alcohol phosphatidyltransferase family protein [Streptosporangium sandarakinum]|uniref:CDP-alcohol phosphatidyltransferase family protein n=1 Tax=Streptosporangium sandarakinum TaxID=1260955 RepID=UPI003434CAA8